MPPASPALAPPPHSHDALLAGDAAAWIALVADAGPRLYALCRRLDADPDDAYQALWEHIHRRLDRFDPGGAAPLSAWLTVVARRFLVDRHRRAASRDRVVAQLRERPPPAIRGPDQQAARRQEAARVQAALERLPTHQRRAVVLHHLEGLALPEIAELEGVPVNTLKSRLHRGRARLAAALGEHR